MRKLFAVLAPILATCLAFAWTASGQQTSTAPNAQAAGTKKAPAAATKPAAPATRAQAPLVLKTQKDKASYAVGLNIGRNMKRDEADIDPSVLARGIRDALNGSKPLLTDDEIKTALTALQTDLRAKQELKRKLALETNEKQGAAFLAANKTKEGVVTLPDGLQYKVLTQGAGPKPNATDEVVCNYRGTLINGTEFDASSKHGGPVTFPVGQVIKGWTEVLQLMPVGSKYQVYIPGELAYGANGAGPDIGPNATLVFDIELLSIKPKTPAPEAPQSTPPAADQKPQTPN